MIVRALDSDGDWTFGAGRQNYLVDQAAVIQTIGTSVKSWVGDCFFDLAAGVDWLNFLGGSKNELALNLAVAATILNTSDQTGSTFITGLLQLSVNLDASIRGFFCAYSVQTIYSQSTFSNSFIYSSGVV